MINGDFWLGKKVLITGHTGFKGSWLTLLLAKLGSKITGVALDPVKGPSLYKLLELSNDIKDIRCDIRDYQALKKIVSNEKPEIIIHMAAQPLVRKSYQEPLLTYETNVNGTVNLLESARNLESLKLIVVVTSDKCYKNLNSDYSYLEDDALGGNDPYSSSKACAEIVTSAYRNSFFDINNVGVATVRAGNVIGGGDWSEDRLIPDAIDAFSKQEDLVIRYPHARRPWQHVFEPITGYLLLCQRMFSNPSKFSGAWNFGPDKMNNQTVESIANKLITLWGHNVKWKKFEDDLFHEDLLLDLNSDKSRKELHWYPVWNWEIALEKTVSWYKEYYFGDSSKIIDYCQNQILSFIQKDY